MQRYSRLLYRATTPMMQRSIIHPNPTMMTRFTPLIQTIPCRTFARQGYLEDSEAMRPMIAPFDDSMLYIIYNICCIKLISRYFQ